MFPTRRMAVLLSGAALLAALGLLAIGCSSSPGSDKFRVTNPVPQEIPIGSPPPAPNSPENALRTLEWCYAAKASPSHRTLFTEDFRFVFSPADPSGDAWRDIPWGREDELAYFDRLVSTSSEISLRLDPSFRVTDDPAHPGDAHKLVRTDFHLSWSWLDLASGLDGAVEFSLVRGDSALAPLELADQTPATSLWFIQRCQELTAAETGLSWGRVRAVYR